MTQQPSSNMPAVAQGALAGAGLGSVSGLLSTLFKKDPKLKDFVKHTLIGGGAGAAAGAGLGGLSRDTAPASPSVGEGAKPKFDRHNASLAGLLPIIGPAIYGATQSADGDRLANALKLGGSSLGTALPGQMLARSAVSGGGYKPGIHLLGSLLAMAGSSYGTGAMADHINKSGATRESVLHDLTAGSDKKLSPNLAAVLGLLAPIVGPGLQGALESGEGQKWENATGLAGASGLGLIGTPIGSAIASYMKANSINAKGEKLQQLAKAGSTIGAKLDSGIGSLKSGIGNLQFNPLNPTSSALAGGTGGAVLGGGIGLLKALLDGEDDGIMGTLRKTLGGAAIGGTGGAVLGGGYSAARRNKLLAGAPEKQRGAISKIMGSYTVPLKSELSRVLHGGKNPYARDIQKINDRAAFSHAVSPTLVRALEQRNRAQQRV